jgi:DNA replication protein DnaC
MSHPETLQASLGDLMNLIPESVRERARQAMGGGDSLASRQLLNASLAAAVEVCGVHGPWHPYTLDASGQLSSQGGLCPSCRKERRQREAYGAMSGIPRLYANASFDNFEIVSSKQPDDVDKLATYAMAIAAGANKNLILLGTPGTGKTHLAIATAHRVSAAGRSVTYINMLDLLDQLRRDRFPQPGEAPGRFSDAITNVDLLIIDECGKQVGNDSEAVAAQRIIDRRVANCMPTIVIGNGSIEDVRQMITGAALDRLMCNCLDVVLEGRSYREIIRDRNRGK